MEHTLTDVCALIVDRPLPPPPGLDQVFKGVRRRGVESVDASAFGHLTDKELKEFYSMILFSFSMLAIMFKGKGVELIVCSVSMGYLIEEAWFTLPLRSIFLIMYFIWEPWFAFDLGYVFLLMDQTFFVMDGGDEELPWISLAVVLNTCRIGYTSRTSRWFQYLMLATSILFAGMSCRDRLVAMYQFWQAYRG